MDTFRTGQKQVVVAGEAEQLVTSAIPVPDGFAVRIIPKPLNKGYIYLGASKVDAEGSGKFDGLDVGKEVSLLVSRLDAVWVNASISGDGVSWLVEK